MRFFVIACLILSVAFSSALIPTPTAQAQACLPDISAASTPEGTPQPSTELIVINEVLLLPIQAPLHCTTPLAVAQLPAGPWIELYNTQIQPFQLVHASLDGGPNTNAFTLTNTSIPAHSFIVVFPYINNAFVSTFTSKLRLLLNGIILDQVELPLPLLAQDKSYARIPDGSPSWQITPNTGGTTSTTIGQSNNVTITIAKATTQPQKKSTAIAKPKTAKQTSTTNATNKQTSNQAQQPSSSSSNSSTVKSQVPQLQPNWKLVRLPTQIAESTPTTPTTPDIPNTTRPPNTPDIPKKIAVSLLVITLALVLWWCRKLFFKT